MPSVHQSCLCFQHTGAIPHCFLSYPPSFHSQHANWLADHRSSADWLADHKSITSPSSSTICTWYSSNFGRVPQAYRCHWILTSNTSSLILVRRALIGWWHHVIFYFNFQGKLIYCQFNWRLCLHLCLPCIEDKRSAMIGIPSFFFQAGLLISPAIGNCLGVFWHDVVFSPFISGFTWFCIYQGFPRSIGIVLINMISLLTLRL
jgi:hypothetical protein